MAGTARHLRMVDPETGEVTEHGCPGCFKRDDEIATLRTEKAGWSSRYHNLRREVMAEESHDLFPAATRLFEFWKERCNHPRTKFKAEHFKACEPYLRDYGEEMCRRAIEGVAYDPYRTQRKNGTWKRHDGWGNIIFKNTESFTEHCNKAPYHLPSPERVKTLADALMHVWSWEPEHAVAEAQRRLR
jgi:hypothetical protein